VSIPAIPPPPTAEPARERLAVCVSSHPLSERLVRTGATLANRLGADWFVIYVETPDRLRFSASHSERLARVLRLAEDLGARVQSVSGYTVPKAIIQFAEQNRVNKIIIGRPLRPRWLEMLNGSIVEEVIRHSGNADVYVISDESGPVEKGLPQSWRPHGPWVRYLQGALLAGLVTLIGIPVHYLINPTNLAMIYLLVVVAAAFFLGRGPSLLTSLISAIAFDFFFTDPRLSFTIADSEYLLTFFGLLGVSLVISNLAGIVRDQVESSQQREAQTAALYALGRELTISLDLSDVIETVVRHVGQVLGRDVAVLLPGEGGLSPARIEPNIQWSPEELAIARWAFRNAQPAGRGTKISPEAAARYEPLVTSQGVAGVLAVRPATPGQYLSPAQRQMLEAYSSLAGLAIERARLAEQASQAQISSATEKLQTALLSSISHDLRTPLASITGAFSSLYEAEMDNGTGPVIMDHETRLELIETGWEEAERMNRLVGNLLDMTRLEGGALRLSIIDSDIEEVIGAALARMRSRINDHPLQTHIPRRHPMTPMDPVLIEQVLVNLVDNAVKYSPPAAEIRIQVEVCDKELEVAVMDRGRGIPAEDLQRIFDRFYRIHHAESVSGSGLGLSICRGIIEAHNGRIWAENRQGDGTAVFFTLPMEESHG
jgi:two-component system, OmpR family, sensor histidine kinase KdpD